MVTTKSWVGLDGATIIVPKDDGLGVMISAFQSREFGFGLLVTDKQLKEVNKSQRGPKYLDETAALALKADARGFKADLKNSPFVKEFEYSVSGEGYWTYQHMVLQLEDCVNGLTVLFPEYAFLFLFDHSCVHDKQKKDGLNMEKMTKKHGGAQKPLHDKAIKQVTGYLGQFP